MSTSARRIEVEGTVQGVGFRPWVHRTACALGLRGRVINTPRGVTIDAFGREDVIEELVRALHERAPRASRVRAVRTFVLEGNAPAGFTIGASEGDGEKLLTVPADLATCDACFAEVADPHDRHYQYAFTSCTECGPRFSLVQALPYDRARTSMGTFALCPECEREYRDLDDRRFHAQAIACPKCGPKLWLSTPGLQRIEVSDPISVVAERLRAGGIVGVQGLGGFHLACDATSADVVRELRRRKHRDDKPFAIMVSDLAAAEALAELDDESRKVLTSAARPIVLAPARPSRIAREVLGLSSRIGLLLPYTPLHRLLLDKVGRPLVMTSGNMSGEPIAISHGDARRTLTGVVDALLLHDRPIVRRVEDSVVSSVGGTTRVVRRARGFAPDSIKLPFASPEPVLAVGAHLKNTACLVLGDRAYVTPHLGDLETYESERAFRADVEGFEKLLGLRAEVVVHDLHPHYASTRYAVERKARLHVGVQHHVAHTLAAVAELHLEGPVIGVAYDGTGWGPDATAWGAEILLVNGLSWSRPASFRPIALAGGERAIREVWRLGVAALHDAFGVEAERIAPRLPVFADITDDARHTIGRMLATGVSTVPARGMGRWFDVFGALVLDLPRASFEGQVAMALEEAARGELAPPYPVGLPTAVGTGREVLEDQEIDLRPAVRAAVMDRLEGVPVRRIAARFHQTVVDATAATVSMVRKATGASTVVLTGGSFQNRLLERGLLEALGGAVKMAREVPVNDGGISLGQAWAGVLAVAGKG